MRRLIHFLAAIVVLVFVAVGAVVVLKERIAEVLIKRYVGVDQIHITSLSLHGDLSAVLEGVNVTYQGQRIRLDRAEVAALDQAQIAGEKPARLKLRGVNLLFTLAIPEGGGIGGLPKLPDFAIPHIEAEDVSGAIRWRGRDYPIQVSRFEVTPKADNRAFDFSARIDAKGIINFKASGSFGEGRLELNIPTTQVEYGKLAQAIGINEVTGGTGVVSMKIVMTDDGMSVAGNMDVQGMALKSGQGVLNITAAKATFLSERGDLSAVVEGLDITFQGQRIRLDRAEVAALDQAQIAGEKPARLKLHGVHLLFTPVIPEGGGIGGPLQLPDFAVPYVEAEDVSGAIRWRGRDYPIQVPHFSVTPKADNRAFDFSARIEVKDIIDFKASGSFGEGRLELNIPTTQVEYGKLAHAIGVNEATGGTGVVSIKIVLTDDGMSVAGNMDVQGMALKSGQGVLNITAARATFKTPDPAKGVQLDGAVVVHGFPRLNLKGRIGLKDLDIVFSAPNVRPGQIELLAALKDYFQGSGSLTGRVSGGLFDPKVSWQFTPEDLRYHDPSMYRKALEIGPAKGEMVLDVKGLKQGSVTASLGGIPVRGSYQRNDEKSGTIHLAHVALAEITDLRRLRPLIPTELLGAWSRDILRQMRRGKVVSFKLGARCDKPLGLCLKDLTSWQVLGGGGDFSGLDISPLPRMPSFSVARARLQLLPDRMVLEILKGGAEDIAESRLTGGRVVALGRLFAPPERLHGTLSGRMPLRDLFGSLLEQMPGLAHIGVTVAGGTASGEAKFTWSKAKQFEGLEVSAKIAGAHGRLDRLGAFKDGQIIVTSLIGKDGVVPVVIKSLSARGQDWSITGAGNIVIAEQQVRPNIALQAKIQPSIVSRFLNDTGGLTWTGGAIKTEVRISGELPAKLSIAGTLDAKAACIKRADLVVKACDEDLFVKGMLNYQLATNQMILRLGSLRLGGQQILQHASARRAGQSWLATARSTRLPWPWLAKRMNVKLPAGASGHMRFDAQIEGTAITARMMADKITLPADIGAVGKLTGTLMLDENQLSLKGDVSLTEPRVMQGSITGTVKNPFSDDPLTRVRIKARDMDVRARWPEQVARARGYQGAKDDITIADVNAWMSNLPDPALPGRGGISLYLPGLKVGQAAGDVLDGVGSFAWGPLHRQVDMRISRKRRVVGLLQVTAKRSDPIEPLAMRAAFAIRDLPLTLIGSWIGQPNLFAGGSGSARGLLKGRFGLPLPYLRGRVQIAAKNLKLGSTGLGAKVFEQAGLPREAKALATDGGGIMVKSIRFLGRFRGGLLHINSLYLNSTPVDVFARGTVNLKDGALAGNVVIKPLQEAASAIANIPLLGYLMAGREKTLFKFTWKLSGDLQNPEISKAPEVDANVGLLGAMRRFDELPSLIFDMLEED